jgi:hypothetical protein
VRLLEFVRKNLLFLSAGWAFAGKRSKVFVRLETRTVQWRAITHFKTPFCDELADKEM